MLASTALSIPFPNETLAANGVRGELFLNCGNLTTWDAPLKRFPRNVSSDSSSYIFYVYMCVCNCNVISHTRYKLLLASFIDRWRGCDRSSWSWSLGADLCPSTEVQSI